jgi:nitroimidazol reductase NimA-like FMN-containing flavoprotein (pyridoxamine 5'-phosphate oxidase superfamily)
MTQQGDPGAHARAIVDANLYMVLGTADEDGRPWVTPVYFAAAGYREFLWVSRPEARHSRNLRVRPELGIVVFDSGVPIGTGRAVYMSARGEELSGQARAEAIEVFSRRSLLHGGSEWKPNDVQEPAPLRLYRATALEHFFLGENDRRIRVDL